MKDTKHIAWVVLAAFALSPAIAGAQEGAEAEGEAPTQAPPEGDAAPPEEAPPEDLPAAEEAPLAQAPTTTGAAASDDFRDAWITLGVRAGVYLPNIVNTMDPHANVTFEVAVLLPFLDRMLGIMVDGSWAGPGNGRERMDPRVGESGGTWTYSMQTHHGFFSAGLIFRFLTPGSIFVPYITAVGRLYIVETLVNGEAEGEEFGQNAEQSTQGGFGVSAGGELRLGPGALLLDVSFGYSDLPHTITGSTSTGALGIQLGYRIFL